LTIADCGLRIAEEFGDHPKVVILIDTLIGMTNLSDVGLRPQQWAMGNGQWAMGNGQWAIP
jgi:hypothetical protein